MPATPFTHIVLTEYDDVFGTSDEALIAEAEDLDLVCLVIANLKEVTMADFIPEEADDDE